MTDSLKINKGSFPAYDRIVKLNIDGEVQSPIYVGKAVPAGARKGGLGLDIAPGTVMFRRLAEHANTIDQSSNLTLSDFFCRYLVVDDIWIPLGESLLIESFSPVWNKLIDGFGNHAPGSGRGNQQCSAWDVLHPGRQWAKNLPPNRKSSEAILKSVSSFFEKHLPGG